MTRERIGAHIGRLQGWDLRFMDICKHISGWSKDPSTKVGAVIVDDLNRIVSTGFNGLPVGIRDIPERLADRDQKYRMTVHGDMNAILFAQRPLMGMRMYTYPFPPCANCAAAIIQVGIKDVLAPDPSDEIWERWGQDLLAAQVMYDESGTSLWVADYE